LNARYIWICEGFIFEFLSILLLGEYVRSRVCAGFVLKNRANTGEMKNQSGVAANNAWGIAKAVPASWLPSMKTSFTCEDKFPEQ